MNKRKREETTVRQNARRREEGFSEREVDDDKRLGRHATFLRSTASSSPSTA